MVDQCTARCPRCNRLSATPHGDRDFYCHHCQMAFSPEDDGTIGYGMPERFVMRDERHAIAMGKGRGGSRR